MKLTWKNNSKNSRKRSLAAVSKLSNLPFEHHQEDDEANNSSNTQLKNKENGSEGLACLDASKSSDAKQLAQSFQAQGNKLAEVSPKTLNPPHHCNFLDLAFRYVINNQFY